MERQPTGLAVVERPRASTALTPEAARTSLTARAALLLALVAVAYRYSLLTLVRSPSGSLVGLAVAVLIAAAVIVRGRSLREPAIHDRYTDFIVAVTPLGGALAVVLLLPSRLSLFFWFWRLDLLSIPLFVGAALALLFGIRTFWRFRFAVGALGLVWLLHAVGLESLPTVAATVAGLGLAGLTMWRRPPQRGAALHSPVRRPVVAAGLLVISAIGATVASGSLERFQPLLRDNGQPPASLSQALPSLNGWTTARAGSYGWIRRYAGPNANWDRYAYGHPGMPRLLADVISSPERSPVLTGPVSDLYRLPANRLLTEREIDLGDGVIGKLVTYVDPARSQWNALYWDWPVQSPRGIRYERVVVSTDELSQSAPQPLIVLATELVTGSAR